MSKSFLGAESFSGTIPWADGATFVARREIDNRCNSLRQNEAVTGNNMSVSSVFHRRGRTASNQVIVVAIRVGTRSQHCRPWPNMEADYLCKSAECGILPESIAAHSAIGIRSHRSTFPTGNCNFLICQLPSLNAGQMKTQPSDESRLALINDLRRPPALKIDAPQPPAESNKSP